MMNTTQLEPRLQKLIDLGESGTDILHGELKNLMYEAEKELIEAQRIEEDNDYSDAMESMERKYWEGQLDAMSHVYGLTYALAFAISERRSKQSNE
jgi:hypothetical protein